MGLILYAGAAHAGENPQSSSGTSGTVRGVVADPSGAAVPAATVTMQNLVSHYSHTVKTDSQGKFQFVNVPFNNYHLSVSASGFPRAGRMRMCARQYQ